MQTIEPINDDEEFSLKDKKNLIKLEGILDDLLEKLEEDIKKFKILYQNLPLKFYNKIDNLRTTSLERKSDDFKRVAYKAKKVSKEFHSQFK